MTPTGAADATGVGLDRPSLHVARITLDRPPRNALGGAARAALLSTLSHLEADDDVRAVILTGSRESFCSGDDLAEMRATGRATAQGLAEWAQVFAALEGLSAPVIAAVNGWALGGGLELALACDLRIASQDARLAAAGVSVGLMASAYRLPRLIGPARAKAMLLTGEVIDAPTALSWGIVTAVHGFDGLAAAAVALADRIASRAPLSVRAAKTLASAAADLEPKEGLARMAEMQGALAATDDHAEAVRAFAEKRSPLFQGR